MKLPHMTTSMKSNLSFGQLQLLSWARPPHNPMKPDRSRSDRLDRSVTDAKIQTATRELAMTTRTSIFKDTHRPGTNVDYARIFVLEKERGGVGDCSTCGSSRRWIRRLGQVRGYGGYVRGGWAFRGLDGDGREGGEG